MMRQNFSGGVRQKLWDALRKAKEPILAQDLYDRAGTNGASARPYLVALAAREYLTITEQQEGQALLRFFSLARNTGPRAPSWSVHTGDFRDWNLEPGMSGKKLQASIKKSGLSIADWLEANGFKRGEQTRIRAMISGQRPVSSAVERAALQPARQEALEAAARSAVAEARSVATRGA